MKDVIYNLINSYKKHVFPNPRASKSYGKGV
jgi:hypothetical protein